MRRVGLSRPPPCRGYGRPEPFHDETVSAQIARLIPPGPLPTGLRLWCFAPGTAVHGDFAPCGFSRPLRALFLDAQETAARSAYARSKPG